MKRFILLTAIFVFTQSAFAQDSVELGEKMFKANCASCHKPDKRLIGPPLQGVAAKYENDFDYITKFVHNSQEVIASGDARAVTIFEEYGKQVMTPFPDLTQEDVEHILAYADSFVNNGDPNQVKLRPISPATQPPYKPLYMNKNIGIWVFYIFIVIILIWTFYMASVLADYKSNQEQS